MSFLFIRLTYFYATNPKHYIAKGDLEDGINPNKINEYISLCRRRACLYKLFSMICFLLAAISDPICAMLDILQYRIIVASCSIGFILIANCLAWPEYCEKLNSIADQLENIRDKLEAGDKLHGHDKIRLRHICEMIDSPFLFSDQKHHN